jgi:CheY-like chemotaxis protein
MVERAIGIIRNNAAAQSQLIEDILDVSRIIGGKLRLNVGQVRLQDVIEAALDSVTPAAQAKAIAIERELEPIDPISGDEDRLQQVVWNLLSNAVKFTPRDGRVTVRLARRAGDVVLSVADSGIGISADFLPYVFDRFSQADGSATRRHGGLGLGMAIVRHLVELHGGTVQADSRGENQGATFTLTLPMQLDAPPPGDVAAGGDPLAAEQRRNPPRLDGVSVLIVDDDPDSRNFLRELLTEHGGAIVTAGSADEALQAFARLRPDVLVSDIAMPGADGYDLIRRVRALSDQEGGRTPAVAVTAYVRIEDQRAALAAGYDRHIRKPVDVRELVSAVAQLAHPPVPTEAE